MKEARVAEFARLKSEAATQDANEAAVATTAADQC